MNSRNITPEMAQAELQRRQAAQGELDKRKGEGGFFSKNTFFPDPKDAPQFKLGTPENKDLIHSMVESAAGMPGMGGGIVKGINALRPSKMLAGNLNPAQLQSNLEAAQGTNTGLGDVIGSPALKRLYENVLPRVPGAGASTAMQGTANQLIEQGQGHLAKLGEGLPEGDLGSHLQDAIKKASAEAGEKNRDNYKAVNDIADKIGLKVDRSNFKDKASEILRRINGSPELKRELDSGFVSDIEHYSQSEKERLSNSAVMKPESKNLSTTNILKGKLNDKASEHYINGKKYEYGLMRELRDSLGKDIEDSISNSKSPELKSAYDYAQKQYGSYYKPFEDPDITKFTSQGGDPDVMLSHFLKGGANDRSTLLQKVTSKLPESDRNLPAYMHLSKALEERQLNPMKFRTLYKNLGEKQKESLIPDADMRKVLDKYTKAVGMNTEAFKTMFNPSTGQRVSDLIPAIGAMGGFKTGMAMGGLPGGLIGGAAGAILPGIAGKGAVNLLTNPSVRDSLVKAIIKAKSK